MMRCIVLFRLIRFRASSDARISLACHFSQNVEELLTRNAACIPDYQPADFLRRVCEMTLDRYIDSETGETRFEQGGLFLRLLRTCKAVVQAENLPAIHYERITDVAKMQCAASYDYPI